MKSLLIFFLFIIFFSREGVSQNYKRTPNGLLFSSSSIQTEIQFYSQSIVRILKYPEGTNPEKRSLSVVKRPEMQELTMKDSGNELILESAQLRVRLHTLSGKIGFETLQGKPLFTEKAEGIQFTPTIDVKEPSFIVRQAFHLDREEAIYGLGQQQNQKLIQRNAQITLKNENMKVCIPYFLSLKGYGTFWDNYATTVFTDNPQETSFESMGKLADYYFMYGVNGQGVIAKMRDLTGQAPMMPLWTFGYFQSKERYKTQDELVGVVEKYRNLKVPIDGIIQDWRYWGQDSLWNSMSFDSGTYPDPQGMVNKIHQLNAHLTIVAWPGFGPLTKQYAEFKSKNMLIDFETWPPNSGTRPYDPYNPLARDIYWNYLNKGIFSKGIDAWWLDSSEPDHINIKPQDFVQPTWLGSYQSVINAFPLVHTQGVYEHQRATSTEKRVYLLTRSAFAGQQRNAANTWSGDVVSTWETLGKQIPAALNFSICAIPYWNGDIGGFFAGHYIKDGGAKNPEFQELYVRWLQFASFTPMMRSHGTDIPREIYQFGEKGSWAFEAVDKGIRLRYRLLPFLYSTAWQVTNQSGSFMNALPLAFPEDVKVRNLSDEFMFGKSFLVAPVIQSMYTSKTNGKVFEDFTNTKKRRVYFPIGTEWINFWTGEKVSGGTESMVEAPIDRIPLFVKSGSIIPWGPEVQFTTEKNWGVLDIRIYEGEDGDFTLYEDEKDSYRYENGLFSTIQFHWNQNSGELTIDERKGSYPGELKNRTFRIVLVNKNSGIGLDSASQCDKIIHYSGKKIIQKIK